ncbi:MAG TPA: ATP-binding protein [Pyrinomonadaceae bacterium]|nr:ATP-binding protein [Pyrinomonadaceae bacterium]
MQAILLVDDEPSLRWTMAELLRRAGYDVETAQDFDSALECFGAGRFEAAVVDIVLPRKSGVQLLAELRQRDADLPVIMMTGEPNLSLLPQIVRAGAYDFLPKPVTKDVLLKAVARAVERRHLSDEKRRLEEEVARHAEELEQVVAERTSELVRARNFLKAVLDSSVEYAIIVTDCAGRVTLFNRGAERIFGYTAEQMAGQPAQTLVAAAGHDAGLDLFRVSEPESVCAGRQLEITGRRADGQTFVASMALAPVQTSDAELYGRVAVIKDLTDARRNEEELRRMQAQLAQNEKIAALGQMAAQVAHEVKNPLAGLRLYTLHLKSKVADKLGESELLLLDKIVHGIENLSGTADQILNFARPLNLTFRPTDLNMLVQDAVQLLESQISAEHVEIHLDLNAPAVMLDEASFRAALVNLLLNAVHAMSPAGGRLTVTTRAEGGDVWLEIADTGCGMSAEQVGRVFEPFYTTKSRGLGLGMPYARKIVEQHAGTIQVESQPGEGTRIQVRLPQAEGGA